MINNSTLKNVLAQVRRELYATEFKMINDAVQKLQQELIELKTEQLRLFDRVHSVEVVVEKGGETIVNSDTPAAIIQE